MAWVLDQCLILLHPIMPFITEELWALTAPRAKLLVHADWPTYGADLIDPAADREMNWVITLIEEIRSARAQMHVPVGLKLADAADQRSMTQVTAAWASNEALIKRLARIDSLTAAATPPKGAIIDRGRRRPLRHPARQASSTSPRKRPASPRRWKSWRKISAACAGG